MAIILALETTEKFGTVAVWGGKSGGIALHLPENKRSAQTLTLFMQEILRRESLRPTDIDAVAVIRGPGSFTGLRVGVTAAKMFAYATGAKIVGLQTHEVIVRACEDRARLASEPTPEFLSIGVDAQRGEVCVQLFQKKSVANSSDNGRYSAVSAAEIVSLADWWRQAARHDDLVFGGPALRRYATKAPETVRLCEEDLWSPQALTAGTMAEERFQQQAIDDLWSLSPIYSRLSAAEETKMPRSVGENVR